MPLRYRSRRPRKVMRRKPRKVAVRRNRLQRQVHMFKRTVFLESRTASTTPLGVETPIAKAYSFQLSDLANVSEYTSLFDQFKITGVKLKVIPKVAMTTQGSATGTTAAVGYGQVVSAIDFDDAATPSSKDQLLEYGSAKFSSTSRIHQRFIKPKVLNAVWVNLATTGYAPVPAPWIDQANSNLPHYGIKLWVDAPANSGGTANSSISYDIYATYYFMCKNTR